MVGPMLLLGVALAAAVTLVQAVREDRPRLANLAALVLAVALLGLAVAQSVR